MVWKSLQIKKVGFYISFLGVDDLDIGDQLKKLAIAKEALVSKENMADDIIGDEEWVAMNPDE